MRKGKLNRALRYLELNCQVGEKLGTVTVGAWGLLAMIPPKLGRPLKAEEKLPSPRERVAEDDVAIVARARGRGLDAVPDRESIHLLVLEQTAARPVVAATHDVRETPAHRRRIGRGLVEATAADGRIGA